MIQSEVSEPIKTYRGQRAVHNPGSAAYTASAAASASASTSAVAARSPDRGHIVSASPPETVPMEPLVSMHHLHRVEGAGSVAANRV